MIVTSLIAIILVLVLVKYIMHMLRIESYVKNLPMGLPFIPIFGNVLSFIGKPHEKIFEKALEIIKTNGTPLKAYLGPILVIAVDSPEDCKTLLTSPHCLDKPYLYQFYPNPFGILTVSSANIWRPIRKLMNPSFNIKILQSYVPIFSSKSQKMLKKLDAKAEFGNFDILPYMSEYTLDMVCASTFDFDMDTSDNSAAFLESLAAYFEVVGKRIIQFWTHINLTYRFTNLCKEEKFHLKNLSNFTNDIWESNKRKFIAQNKNKYNNNPNVFEESEDSYKTPQGLIDQLLEEYYTGKYSEKFITDQIETIMIAGNETTTFSLTYIILLLAMYPDIQDKVYEELRSVFDSQDEEVTYEHFQKLPYLDRVILEGMRILPIAPFIVRSTGADVQFSNCTVPKDSFIIMSSFTLHRRKDIWGDDAEEFNPDHFLPENVAKRDPFAFLPFSGGPRNCMGFQHGMILMQVALCSMLRRFKFTTDLKMSDLILKFVLTLKLNNVHSVGMERRVW